jgi:dihydroorotate dehydrogenase (NAD+) catalytic subunit
MEYLKDQDPIPDLRVSIGPLTLANPVMTASGTFGYAREFEELMNLHSLGAIIVKGISLSPRAGNPPPRIVETACGMLNAIGLQNVGVDRFLAEKMEYLGTLNVPIIVNILGESLDEYRVIAEKLSAFPAIAAIEVNLKKRRPQLANVIGGLSGPAIKPVALRMVYQVARAVSVPVIGIGGIATAEDALEFILAGATAVQVGTANFVNPRASEEVVRGIGEYVLAEKLPSVREIIGALEIC